MILALSHPAPLSGSKVHFSSPLRGEFIPYYILTCKDWGEGEEGVKVFQAKVYVSLKKGVRKGI